MSGSGDWVSNTVAGIFALGILGGVSACTFDRIYATFQPEKYAAEQAAREAEQAALDAPRKAQEAAEAVAQAERDKVQAKQEMIYNNAQAALENLKQSLRDPESAQFRDVWIVEVDLGSGPINAVCGVVNARNAFGGYTGDTPFIAAGASYWTPDDGGFGGTFNDICIGGKKVMAMNHW